MKGFTLWLTGASPALAASVARGVEEALLERGSAVEFVGGEEARARLGAGPRDSAEERAAYARRVGFVCRLLSRNGVAAIAAEPLPTPALREELRGSIERWVEVELRVPGEGPAAGAPGSAEEAGPHVVMVANEDGAGAAAEAIVSILQSLGHVSESAGGGYSADEEEAIKARLRDLGYI
jgi:hypothetical protein